MERPNQLKSMFISSIKFNFILASAIVLYDSICVGLPVHKIVKLILII